MFESLLAWMRKARIPMLGVALLLFGFSAWQARKIEVNDASERWLPQSILSSWERFSEHYKFGDMIIVGVEFRRDIDDVEDLKYLKELTKDFKAMSDVGSVITPWEIAEEVERVPLSELIREADPNVPDVYALYRGILFDRPNDFRGQEHGMEYQGRTLMAFIQLAEEGRFKEEGEEGYLSRKELDELRRRVTKELYAVLEKHERDDIVLYPAGGVIIQYELEEIARDLLVNHLPYAGAVVFLALGVVFRSIPALAIAVLGAFWSIGVLLGGVVLAGGSLNVLTVCGPALIVVLTVSSTMHIAHHHSLTHSSDNGESYQAESRHLIHWVAVPCLGAATTTGIGFLMLAFNELGPARELGFELSIGSLLAFSGAFLVWIMLPPFRTAPGRILSGDRLGTLQKKLTRFPLAMVSMLVLLLGVLGFSSTKVTLDADPFAFFQSDSRIAHGLQHFTDRKFGLHGVDIILIPKNQPTDPEELKRSRLADRKAAIEFEQKMTVREEVRNVISADRLSRSRQQNLIKVGLNYWEMLKEGWFTPQAIADVINHAQRGWEGALTFHRTFENWTEDQADQGAMRVTFLVYDPGEGFDSLMKYTKEHLPTDRFEAVLTGTAVNTDVLSNNLAGGVMLGLSTALVAMILVCFFLFRSFKLTALAMLPNLFPVLVVFGVMGFFGYPLNTGSAIVTPIALGIGLNDTVHFLMYYRNQRELGTPTEESIEAAFREIGRPIILTSLIMCLGFALFYGAEFRPLHDFGLLSSIAMCAALVGDLFLLPNLLKLFDKRV